LQGSNNGSSWTDLHTVTDEDSWTASETKAYDEGDFTNTTAYRYYRLHITEAKFGSYAGVAELHLPAPPVGPDFRHDFEVTHQSGTTGRAAVWALSNDLDDVKNWDDDDDEAVSVTLVGAASPTLVLTDHESGASDTSTALTTQTTYYCTVERTADTTVECRIYSDLGRTTLVDTLSVSVTSGRTWRYLVACNSYNDNEADAISFDVENLRAGDETIDYYYNTAWQVVEERKDGSSDPLAQYVWDIRYIDAPVLRWRDDNLNGDFLDSNETLYYTQDANFNVTALVNTSGTVLERTMYDPYGKPTFYDANWANPSDSSAYANEVLFAGYRYDTETGLYHVRHRAHHPTLGRWMQRDPVGYDDGLHLYAYALTNPVLYIDPMGLSVRFRRTCFGSVQQYLAYVQEKERRLQDKAGKARSSYYTQYEQNLGGLRDFRKGYADGRVCRVALDPHNAPTRGAEAGALRNALTRGVPPTPEYRNGRMSRGRERRVEVLDPCLIVLFIGHAISRPADQHIGEISPFGSPEDAEPNVNIRPYKDRYPGTRTPTVGAASCFAGLTRDQARAAGYDTLRTGVERNELVAGTPRQVQGEAPETYAGYPVNPESLVQHAARLFERAKERAEVLCDEECCTTVRVVIIYGPHHWTDESR